VTGRLPGDLKGVLFDLDGTLIDSRADLAEAVNDLMLAHGLPAHGAAAVIGMVGHGAAKLVERAFAGHGRQLSSPELVAATGQFLALYAPRATRLTRAYPGVETTVAALDRVGLRLAVVTNKPEAIARSILADLGLAGFFASIVGGDRGPARKPAPDLLLLACRELGIMPEQAVMVGDSEADITSARAARMGAIAVSYGFSAVAVGDLGADAVVDAMPELIGLLVPGGAKA